MSGLVLLAILLFLIISLGFLVGREQFLPGFQAMLNQESGYDAGSKGYFNPVYAVEVAQDLQ
jgi:hypothetical protein